MNHEEVPNAAENEDDIRRRAAAFSEARNYSLRNEYLTPLQKADIEAWYQLPIGLFCYTVLAYLAIYGTNQYTAAFFLAYVVATIVGLLNWLFPLRPVIKLGYFFAGTFSMLVDLGFAGFFAFNRAWIAAGIGLASAFGLISIISPTMHLYNLLARGMHPKYHFAKRYFGVKFPFEEHLDLRIPLAPSVRLGLTIGVGIFLWNLLLLLIFLPWDHIDVFNELGFMPAFYAGLPWSWGLMIIFGGHGAVIENEICLLISLMINGYLLGLILKTMRGR